MAGSDPQIRARILIWMAVEHGGDVAADTVMELLNMFGLNSAHVSLGKQKRALASLIYNSGAIRRYHDKEGQRHFEVVRPQFVA